MPLVTAAVLAYAAGLLSGFGGVSIWMLAAAALVVWGGARTRRDRTALATIAIAGFATASIARGAQASCFERLLAAPEWEVTLAGDASPGAFVLGRHSCGVKLRIAAAEGRAAAGARVVVRGDAVRARDAILVTKADLRVVRSAGALARWRATVGRGIDARFGTDAPLVRALLIADMHDLSPTLRDRFAAAGLSHMLSVSGLHVGLIAVAVSLVAQLVGFARRRADLVVVVLTGLYVLVIGAPLPAVRAAVMLATVSLSMALQRPTSAWAVLAVGAAVPLYDAAAVLDVGYQLSVIGMVALVASGALVRRWSWLSAGGWRGTLYRSLVASTAATLLTAPLVASVFGRISLVAPVSNLVAVPIMAVLQPMLFLAALLLPFSPLAQFVADASRPLIAAVDRLATFAADLPGASVPVVADEASTALACVAATAFVVAAVSRHPGGALIAGASCVALIAWRPLMPQRSGMTELHLIDVGQGDAIALRTTRGRWVLFDAGRDWEGGDAGKRDIVPYLATRGGPLVGFVLSHPHADHVGGAASTLHALKPSWYVDPGYAGGSSSYRASLLAAQTMRTRWQRVRPGDSVVVDEAAITFLAPDSAWAESLRDPNDASTVARIRVGQVTLLLTGDAEADEEQWLLARQLQFLRADVLKVAHHGSSTSSTPEFLAAVQPRLALVSVGAGNMYRHPSPAVMESLAAHGAITMRTDRDGTIIVRTDGSRIEVESRGERWTLKTPR
ncbi:MAG: DNA internalization-related competence protein ComEC/Rec2 [Gemmatimonadaceae bacterium]